MPGTKIEQIHQLARAKCRALLAVLPTALGSWLERAWKTTILTFRTYFEIDGEQRAASFAYYVLFSLIPLVAIMLTIGSTFVNSHEVAQTISGFIPLGADQQKFIWENVHRLEERRGGINTISITILLWSSLRFFLALVRAVNRAWHTVEIEWWQLPLKNLLMIAVTGSALLAGLLAPAILQGVTHGLLAAEQFVLSHFPTFNLHLVSVVLDLSRYLIGGLVLFYSFSMLYMLAPRNRVSFRKVWFAAILVTLGLQACQIAFVNYLPRFVDYGIFGAVGWLMLLLLWVYISGIIIILGGCLCAAAHKVWDNTTPASSES